MRLTTTIAIVLLLLIPRGGWCAELKLSDRPYTYMAQGVSLRQVLTDFFSMEGIPVVISEKVQGQVSGSFVDVLPAEFLEDLVNTYGIIWYYDGVAVYIYSVDEVSSEIIQLKNRNVKGFEDVLKSLDIYDERFPLRAVPEQGLIFLAGPPKYVALVKEAARAFSEPPVELSKEVIRVFPLKYAWAVDHTVVIQDQEITVPGVATILRDILSGSIPEDVSSPKVKRLAYTLQGLKGKGLASAGKKEETDTEKPSDEKDKKQSLPVAARIAADTRLNAIIIRDIKEKMPLYEELIRILDVPSGIVQINVTIVDVSTDQIKELGLNWRLKAPSYGRGVGVESGLGATENLMPGQDVVTGEGLNLATTISVNAGRFLLAKIHALQKKGKAKIVARPSLLTINNVQAVISQTQTFYARVAGKDEVDLFNVSAGLVLKVTPHIVDRENKKIKLIVDIEDGYISTEQAVDSLPVIPKSTIHTQAIVSEEKILVLGGYIYETNNVVRRGVPLLSDIPVLGALFSYNMENVNRRERIFLIHSKIVTPEQMGMEEAARSDSLIKMEDIEDLRVK